MKRAKCLRLAALALGGAVLLSGCVTRTEPAVSTQVFVMDTIMSLELWEGGGQEQLNQAVEQLYHWEDLWSATDENSEIWAVDHSGGEWVSLSEETAELLFQALELCRLTGGALDLTAYSAVKAWGFTTGEYRVPGEAEQSALAEGIDYTQVELDLDGRRVRLPAGMELDLGAVAKGYAGARLAERLREQGVTSALLNLGGNVQTVGGKPDGAPPGRWGSRTRPRSRWTTCWPSRWWIRLWSPPGSYQRYFQQDGQTYWHILDPKTAAPARTGLASVTVVGPDGTVCDGLATALFVLGEEAGIELWRAHSELDVQVIWVREDGSVALTEGLEENYRVNPQRQDLEITVVEA